MANLVIPRGQYFDTDNVISVSVPVGSTLSDGALLVAGVLKDIRGNDIYEGAIPTANTDDFLCMVVGNEYYHDAQGNQINVSDPTQINYFAGNVIRAYRLVKNRRFNISNGAITGTPTKGQYLIPTAGGTTLTVSATIPADVKYALVMEEINKPVTYTGLKPLTGVIARVVVGD